MSAPVIASDWNYANKACVTRYCVNKFNLQAYREHCSVAGIPKHSFGVVHVAFDVRVSGALRVVYNLTQILTDFITCLISGFGSNQEISRGQWTNAPVFLTLVNIRSYIDLLVYFLLEVWLAHYLFESLDESDHLAEVSNVETPATYNSGKRKRSFFKYTLIGI